MKLKQRDVNRAALLQAAALIESEDFESLFGSGYGWGETDAETGHNDATMEKAQALAVRRIRALAGGKEPRR